MRLAWATCKAWTTYGEGNKEIKISLSSMRAPGPQGCLDFPLSFPVSSFILSYVPNSLKIYIFAMGEIWFSALVLGVRSPVC